VYNSANPPWDGTLRQVAMGAAIVGDNEITNKNGSPPESTFTKVFVGVLILTILCLAGSGLVVWNLRIHIPTQAYTNDDTRLAAKQVSDALMDINQKLLSIFTLGCGAIMGLLGGKSLSS
jgi:hypothetical protein